MNALRAKTSKPSRDPPNVPRRHRRGGLAARAVRAGRWKAVVSPLEVLAETSGLSGADLARALAALFDYRYIGAESCAALDAGVRSAAGRRSDPQALLRRAAGPRT